jgi:hypothetical protein
MICIPIFILHGTQILANNTFNSSDSSFGLGQGALLTIDSYMGGASTNKYAIDYLVYPDHLNQMMDTTSYVVFHIIVDNESKLLKGNARGEQTSVGIGNTLSQAKQVMMDTQTSINSVTGGKAVTSLGTGVVTAATMSISGLGMISDALSSPAQDVKGDTKSISSTFGDGMASTFMRTKNRLKHSIVLPMPADFTTTYTAGWQEGDSNLLIDTLVDPNGVKNAAASMKDPKTLGKIAGGTLSTMIGTIMPAQQKITGVVSNPRKTQLFDSMALREFTFNYSFAPMSRGEYTKIQKIIAAFKYYMHPEWQIDQMGSNSPFLRVPSEFDIEFKHCNGENGNINKIATCVLTGCTVHYTPGGTWSKHPNGEPTQINVSLHFKELSMVTKERIAEGF